jgi:hypothetical protein
MSLTILSAGAIVHSALLTGLKEKCQHTTINMDRTLEDGGGGSGGGGIGRWWRRGGIGRWLWAVVESCCGNIGQWLQQVNMR